jgi:hypothetical protein
MKYMARDLVKFHFRDALFPEIDFCHNSDQREQIISDNVKKLIAESLFLQGPPDAEVSSLSWTNSPADASQKQGRTDNFGNSVISDLLKKFYYNEKSDCLSVLFPASFKTCPNACLAMACTCVGNPLHVFFFVHHFLTDHQLSE